MLQVANYKLRHLKEELFVLFITAVLSDVLITFISKGFYSYSIFPRTIPVISFLFFIILALAYPIHIIKKWKNEIQKIIISSIPLAIISIIVWGIIPNKYHPINANYTSVSWIKISEFDDLTTFDLHRMSRTANQVFSVDEIHSENIQDEYYIIGNFKVNVLDSNDFLFWQKSLLYGHNPNLDDMILGTYGISSKVYLFFIIGPMIFIECLIRTAMMHFPIAIIYLIYVRRFHLRIFIYKLMSLIK